MVSCGEPSGRLLAGLLERALQAERSGTEVLVHAEEPVFGFWEGVKASHRVRARIRALSDCTAALKPDAVVPIAFSGFNLGFGRRCRAAGRPVIYLSPPQVWAWGGWRVRDLRRAADRVVCLLPFEEKLLREAGIAAFFFGNPLVDETDRTRSREETCAALGLAPDREYVAFLPGSRPAEIRFHRPLFERAALALEHQTGASAVFVHIGEQDQDEAAQDVQVRYSIIKHAAAAVVVSGTATLEAVLLGTPQVVCYHLGQPTRLLAHLLVRSRHFALPNIILGRRIVPELLEPAVDSIVAELGPLLGDRDRRDRMLRDYAEVRGMLGAPGAMGRIAQFVIAAAGQAAA